MNLPKESPALLDELRRVGRIVTEREDANAVPSDGGALLHALTLNARARHALELGTGLGYSGLWIAAALRRTGGSLLTIDANREKSESARSSFDRAGLGNIVTTRIGDIAEFLSGLADAFDFVFIDADKDRMVEYWRLLLPRLTPAATIVTDNVNTHPQQLSEFLSHVRSLPDFYSAPLNIGNGMELTIRLPREDQR